MKKITVYILAAILMLSAAGCGRGNEKENEGEKASEYTQALDVMNAVKDAYAQDDLFAMYGGDQEHAVTDAPGKFDMSKTEELTNTLGLPQSQVSVIDDAASMVHMMNANTFTSAVYHLKEGTDMENFADTVKENILAKQWICGQPDKLLIIRVDGEYVLTAYGEAQMMEVFKANALTALGSARVLTEAPIA